MRGHLKIWKFWSRVFMRDCAGNYGILFIEIEIMQTRANVIRKYIKLAWLSPIGVFLIREFFKFSSIVWVITGRYSNRIVSKGIILQNIPKCCYQTAIDSNCENALFRNHNKFRNEYCIIFYIRAIKIEQAFIFNYSKKRSFNITPIDPPHI